MPVDDLGALQHARDLGLDLAEQLIRGAPARQHVLEVLVAAEHGGTIFLGRLVLGLDQGIVDRL